MTRGSIIAMLVLALAGCGSSGQDCRVGADCASGICLSDGTCAPIADDGDAGLDGQDGQPDGGDAPADLDDGGGDDVIDGGDAEADGDDDPDGGGDDGGITCSPNQDGIIERSEVPIRVGLRATFLVSGRTDVDTAGVEQPDGSRIWDLSGDLDGDQHVLAELRDPTGTWFAPVFPDATYYGKLREGEDLLGVFRATDQALQLLGVVSPDDGLLRTELTYDPPVDVLRFPLMEGSAWATEATISGTASGAWSYYFEDYASQVDAAGELVAPYGTLQVLRVRSVMTRTVGMLVTKVRTFMFVAECFGTVAVITSTDNESEVEFTRAAEVRRLAP